MNKYGSLFKKNKLNQKLIYILYKFTNKQKEDSYFDEEPPLDMKIIISAESLIDKLSIIDGENLYELFVEITEKYLKSKSPTKR